MPVDFENYDNSETAEAINALHGTKTIEVLVEGIEDIAFWYEIFKEYENSHQLRFNVRVSSYANSNKNTVLPDFKINIQSEQQRAGKCYLLCVDSDYDYLLCDLYDTPSTSLSQQEQDNINTVIQKAQIMKNNEFIFQTYAYAMENLKCFADSLHGICVKATFNTKKLVHFPDILAYYSELVYELLLWNLLFRKKGITNPLIYPKAFILKEFTETVKILTHLTITDMPKAVNDMQIFKDLAEKVSNKLNDLRTHSPSFEAEIPAFANALKLLGLEPTNAYLFMQGHCLFDNVVYMILHPVIKNLQSGVKAQIASDIEIKAIEKTAAGASYNKEENRENKKTEYENLQPYGKLNIKVKTALRNNYDFKSCFLFSKMKQDIDTFIHKYWTV